MYILIKMVLCCKTLPKKKKGIPVVTGGNFGNFTVGEAFKTTDEGVFESIMNVSQLISHYNISVKQLHIESGALILYSGKLKIYLGKKKRYDDEMNNLARVFETAVKEKLTLEGTIHMENYKAGDSIVVDPPKKTNKNVKKTKKKEEN